MPTSEPNACGFARENQDAPSMPAPIQSRRVARLLKPLLITALSATLLPAISRADSPVSDLKIETIATGLDSPLGVAVRPTHGDVYVSEGGAGRVVWITLAKNAKPVPAVVGFAVGTSPDVPDLRAGPMGLAFVSSDDVVVGSGGQGPGKDAVRLFELRANHKPLTIDDAKRTLTVRPGATAMHTGLAGKSASESKNGEGWFFGIATVPYAIFATSRSAEGAGWISRSSLLRSEGPRTREIIMDLRPFIDSSQTANAGGPVAATVSKQGELVVSHLAKFDQASRSTISFYNPDDSKLLLNLSSGLRDIVGLAYSPQTRLLYAVDLAWAEPKEGGLFRLDATQDGNSLGIKAIKIASLDRPTSLAFAPDGTLYVTTLGQASADKTKKTGQLLKITGGL